MSLHHTRSLARRGVDVGFARPFLATCGLLALTGARKDVNGTVTGEQEVGACTLTP